MDTDTPTVFVVDDDVDLLASMSRSLGLRGFQVETFGSAEAFLACIDFERTGCLVLDFGLPGMSGLELQEYLNDQGIGIPIIFITGHGGVPESVRATKAGAVDFLEKPYKPEVLFNLINAAFEINRDMRERMTQSCMLEGAVTSLTEREREIFDLFLTKPEIVSSKAVALELDISPRTVEKHRAQVLLKTDCRSVAELIGRYTEFKPSTEG